MSTNVITDKGDNHIALIQANPSIPLNFLSVFVGSGIPSDSTIDALKAMEAIISEEKEGRINSVKALDSGKYAITISYDNDGIEEAFDATEIVIKVRDPEDPLIDYVFLYSYEENPDHLPVAENDDQIVEHTVTFTISISGVSNPLITLVSTANINKTSFGENSILKSDEAENPESLNVPISTIIGRKSLETDKISALSVSEVRKLLSISDYGCRHAIQSWGNGVDLNETIVKGNELLSEEGTGGARSIDFGLDAITKHLFYFAKNSIAATDWGAYSTLTGVEKELYFNKTNKLTDNPESVKAFTNQGVNIGSDAKINANGGSILEFAMHCTHEHKRNYKNVKSVLFDFANNYGSVNVIAIKSIEFYSNGALIALTANDFSAFSTTDNGEFFKPENAFNTSLLKTGSSSGTSWQSQDSNVTNQRLSIVFNSTISFDRIVINNYHSSGTGTTNGAKNTKIHISTDPTPSIVYEEDIPNSELIFDGQIAQHAASDIADDKNYTGVHLAYNPATGFYMQLHDGDSGLNNFPIRNWMDKHVIWDMTKNLDFIYDNFVYNIFSGVNFKTLLNTTVASSADSAAFNEMSDKYFRFGTSLQLNEAGHRYLSIGWVGEDLGAITPGMWGIEGAVSIKKVKANEVYNCAINKIKAVYAKKLDGTSNHFWYNPISGWTSRLFLDSPSEEANNVDGPSFSGSEITIPSAWAGDWLVMVIGEDGNMPEGSSINIRANDTKPAIFSIADGFDKYGPNDNAVIETADKVIPTPSTDGLYEVCVDAQGNYTFEEDRPDFDNTPGIMRGSENKLPIMTAAIMDSKVVDIDLYPVGDSYEVGWFPVKVNSLYPFKNLFKSTKIDVDIWWSEDASDDNKRKVTFDTYYASAWYGAGGTIRISMDYLYIGTGYSSIVNTIYSGDPISIATGYYKVVVRRLW